MADCNRESEQEFKNRLNEKLQNSGEIEQLKQTLRERLQSCGWTDQMKKICKGIFGANFEKKYFDANFKISRAKQCDIDAVFFAGRAVLCGDIYMEFRTYFEA